MRLKTNILPVILSLSGALVPLTAHAYTYNLLPTPSSITYSFQTSDIGNTTGYEIKGDNAAIVKEVLNAEGICMHGNNVGKKLFISITEDKSIPPEGYKIVIGKDGINLSSSDDRGLYYSAITLSQMLKQAMEREEGKLRLCTVTDSPRFGYRGMMIDVVRCYIPVDELKRLVDEASRLKINNIHLHLTDDNGWRLEIKRYPRLASVGGWRVDRPEIFPGRLNARSEAEPATYGGVYSQKEMRELVEYAAKKHVNIIPEIELPAHAAAAIASYPDLACPVDSGFRGVFPGIGGKDASIIICGGNDKAIEFYKNVLDEVMDIFPSQKIHLGGDEANKTNWKKCPKCQERIRKEHLADEEALQGWFMDRIAEHVVQAGRTPVGWDEATYGNPTKEMTIMGWQGDGNVAVKDAAKSGRKFIMTPAKKLYLIRYQGPQWFEPFTYFGNNTLSDVYNYEPVGDDWSPELESQLEGIQGSLWTEFCRTPSDVEYLLFPRMLAVAERAWTSKDTKDWLRFLQAADAHLARMEENDIRWARSMYNIQQNVRPYGDGVKVTLTSERPDLTIKYAVGTPVFDNAMTYTEPIVINEPVQLFAATFDGEGKQMGETLILPIFHNKATGKKVTGEAYNGLQDVLTNGVRGSYRNSDFEWAGWHNSDAEFVIDLGETVAPDKVTLGSLVHSDICVAAPRNVTLEGSTDGNNFVEIGRLTYDDHTVWRHDAAKVEHLFNLPGDKPYRYLRFKASNPGKVPDGMARVGAPTWMYFDEVTVE